MHRWENRWGGCQQAAGAGHGPCSRPRGPAPPAAQPPARLQPPFPLGVLHPPSTSAGPWPWAGPAALTRTDITSSGSDGSAGAAAATGTGRCSRGAAAAAVGGRRRGDGRWVCRAAGGPLVRRPPPLRLQGRGAEEGGGTGGAAGAGEGGEEEGAEGEEEGVAAGGLLPGVARVQCVQDLPRFDLPLLLGSFRSSSCNAVAVSYCGQSYLLAPAASVVYGSQIRVLLPGRDKPFPARLLHLGPECELAVLGVDSPYFWDAIRPYELAPYGLPQLQQHVGVVSYADGQPRPRSAPGTVMRAEVVTYPSALQRLLGVTVAVALSRDQIGSALVDSKGDCLGVVFARTAGSGAGGKRAGGGGGGGPGSGGSGSGSGERWGQGRRRVGRRRGRRGPVEAAATVVPVPVVAHFLEDIRRHGSYQGFPTLGIQWKRTESAALRRYAGLTAGQTGVVITSLNPTSALATHARPLDVLAAVGEAAVGDDGTVAFRGGADSIHISYHISQFQVGDRVDLTLLRGGRPVSVPLELGLPHRLMPLHLAGAPPQYLVVSGLVLTPLSAPFLEGAFGRSWAVRAPVQLLREWHNHPTRPDEQVVVVAECTDLGPGSGTDGYERRAVMHQRVVRCNGEPLTNLTQLATKVAEATARALQGTAAAAAALGASVIKAGRRGGKRRGGGGGAPRTVSGSGGGTAAAAEPDDGSEAAAGVAAISDVAASAAAEEYIGDRRTDCGNGGGGPPYDPANLVLELSNRMLLVLPLAQAATDTRKMLAEYEVQYEVSEDLQDSYMSARQGRLGPGAAAESGKVAGGKAGARGRAGVGRAGP